MLEDIEKYLNKSFWLSSGYKISLVTGNIVFFNDFSTLGFVSKSLDRYIQNRKT